MTDAQFKKFEKIYMGYLQEWAANFQDDLDKAVRNALIGPRLKGGRDQWSKKDIERLRKSGRKSKVYGLVMNKISKIPKPKLNDVEFILKRKKK